MEWYLCACALCGVLRQVCIIVHGDSCVRGMGEKEYLIEVVGTANLKACLTYDDCMPEA
jgi:hypothetical protein